MRFTTWRRSRPFWGGALAVLGGLELLAIPFAPLPLVIQRPDAGASTWLVGALLMAVGIGLWLLPRLRPVLGTVIVALAVTSFVTSNFGGFLLGLVLTLAGGALALAWSPLPSPEPASEGEAEEARERPSVPAQGTSRERLARPYASAPLGAAAGTTPERPRHRTRTPS